MTPPVPDSARTARAIKLILALQAGLAALLVLADLGSGWQPFGSRSAPAPGGPVTPGDQVRRYEPERSLPRFGNPEQRPDVNLPDNLPSRLEFDVQTATGAAPLLVANGAIAPGDDTRFAAYLDTLPDVPPRIAINSPGGDVDTALVIGRMIRDRGLDTQILPGTACLSACPYLLAGGVARQVSRAGAVGLHQHYFDTPGYLPVFLAVADIQRGQGATMQHLIDMGIDPGVMVHGLTTPPDDIYVLVEAELIDSRLATAVTD